ncbi:nuclease-related domain-containing protein [Mucilaginibacter pedocola]|uniref:nuclease-related domain-containing protein n=1 Tax=Mucilaginibacter pedocola TaxID=1792845 RepID=UPI0013904A53|nr:nuclease-related domain-containing protein [Mucilaginibacter pedocola]
MNELISFQKSYSVNRQGIISKHQHLVEEEKRALAEQIPVLENLIHAKEAELKQIHRILLNNLEDRLTSLSQTTSKDFGAFIAFIKRVITRLQIWYYKTTFHRKFGNALKDLKKACVIANNRYEYINSNFEKATQESGAVELAEIDKKKSVIDDVNNSIYGAIGELKVVEELKKLPDDHVLINDFSCTFNPPIYDHNTNGYIYSVQIDHILISPAGIFLIETKNWSLDSINNLNLYSPVQQVRRAGTALYKLLNSQVAEGNLSINSHHWGHRKIAVKNLIVLMNYKPVEEFQYVKVLTLNKLVNHVNYFQRCFSANETDKIASQLLSLLE